MRRYSRAHYESQHRLALCSLSPSILTFRPFRSTKYPRQSTTHQAAMSLTDKEPDDGDDSMISRSGELKKGKERNETRGRKGREKTSRELDRLRDHLKLGEVIRGIDAQHTEGPS